MATATQTQANLPEPSESRRETEPSAGAPAELPKQIGRYEIRRELGRGGVGVVYEAWDPQLERAVALKTLIAGRDASQNQIDRFLREVRATAHLRHPHIVSVHDAGVTEGRFYLAMDVIEGRPLDEILDKDGALGPRRAVRLLRPIVQALDYAHSQGIIHRDVKPENILVDERDEAYLTDFGLALDLADSIRLTQTNQSMGTPAFMAPEQLQGRSVDPRVDVYSIGATLYEALTGQVPFEGLSFPDLLDQIRLRDPVPPRFLQPRVAPDLEAVVLQCLEKDPARRYASPGELAADLERFQAGEAVKARAPSLARKIYRRLRRYRPLLLGAVVALIGVVGGLSYALVVENASGAALRKQAFLEKERARLLVAKREADRRYEHEEARRAAFIAAALATTTEGQIAAYSRLLQKHQDSWEGRIARARLLRVLCQERRVQERDLPGARRAALRATDDLDHALRVTTRPAPLLLLKAEILRADLKDAAAATRAYTRLVRTSERALADYGRARLAFARGELKQALRWTSGALEARSDLSVARVLRVEVQLRRNQAEQTQADLELLAGNASNKAEVIRLRAEVSLRTVGTAAARSDALRAQELDPTEPRVYALLGRLYLRGRKPQEALRSLVTGAKLAPRDPELLLLLALARLRADGDLPRAISLVGRARRTSLPLDAQLLGQVRRAALKLARERRIELDEKVRTVLGL